MGKCFSKNIQNNLHKVKPKCGCSNDKLNAYKQLKSVERGPYVATKPRYLPYIRKYFNVRAGIQAPKAEWWHHGMRKSGKDRLRLSGSSIIYQRSAGRFQTKQRL